MFKRDDWIFGLISTALGLGVIYFVRDLRGVESMDPAGPTALPTIISYFMIVIGLIHIVGSLNIIRKDGEQGAENNSEKSIRPVIYICVACSLYILCLETLGYLITTPLLIMAIMMTVGVRDIKRLLSTSLVTTFILFAIFYFCLKVPIPLGLLTTLIE